MNRSSNVLTKLLDKCSNFLFGIILLILTVGLIFLLHESESIEILCSGDGCKIIRDHRGKCTNANHDSFDCIKIPNESTKTIE